MQQFGRKTLTITFLSCITHHPMNAKNQHKRKCFNFYMSPILKKEKKRKTKEKKKRERGGHVSHPSPLCTAVGRMCFVCQLASVLMGVICAVMSVKYISQLGNVGKLTPVQCLTNHIIKRSLHIH